MKFELGDKVYYIGSLEYKDGDAFCFAPRNLIGEIVDVSLSGFDVKFILPNGQEDIRFFNSFHLEPVNTRLQKDFEYYYKSTKELESVIDKIKEII